MEIICGQCRLLVTYCTLHRRDVCNPVYSLIGTECTLRIHLLPRYKNTIQKAETSIVFVGFNFMLLRFVLQSQHVYYVRSKQCSERPVDLKYITDLPENNVKYSWHISRNYFMGETFVSRFGICLSESFQTLFFVVK